MFRKLRSSKIVKTLQVALVCFQVCKSHHEKIFFHGGNKQLFFPYFHYKIILCSTGLFECTFNFKLCQNIFIFLNINTNQTSSKRILWEAATYFGRSYRKCPGILCLEVNCQTCTFTGVFEDFGHIFLTCFEKITEILKVGKIFWCVTDFNFKFNR